MRIRELQTALDARWPGAWAAKRSVGGFRLIRADAVEMLSIPDLMQIHAWAERSGSSIYVTHTTIGAATSLAIWLSMPPLRARKIRKPDRRASERRRGGKRRISDKARR